MNDIWFSVIQWPPEDNMNTVEVSHFSSEEKCKTAIKEFLEDIFEMSSESLSSMLGEARNRGFTVWHGKAEVK